MKGITMNGILNPDYIIGKFIGKVKKNCALLNFHVDGVDYLIHEVSLRNLRPKHYRCG
jgi:hypothetical protein